jgi:hypothetical protein
MIVRLKWLLIGFVAGAAFGAAGAKYGPAAPGLVTRFTGGSSPDDAWPEETPAEETPAE